MSSPSGPASRSPATDRYYDAAVSGADPIEGREGFALLLDRVEGNGVRIVLVQSWVSRDWPSVTFGS